MRRALALLGLVASVTFAAEPAVQPLDLGPVSLYPGALSVSADGRWGAHVDGAGHVVLWDVATAQVVKAPPAGATATSVALSADGAWLAVGHVDGRLVLWSRTGAVPTHEFRGHSGRLLALAFSPDGRRLASGSSDGTTQLFDVQSGQRLQVLDSVYNGHQVEGVAEPVAVVFAAGGRLLLTHDWQRRQYDVGRLTTQWALEQGIEITTRDVAPPSNELMQSGQAVGAAGWLLAYTAGEHLMVQRLDGCAPARALPLEGYADTLAVDPQGRWVAQSRDEVLTFLDLAGRTMVPVTLPGRALALVPLADGRSVLAVLGSWSRATAPTMLTTWGTPPPLPGKLVRIAVPAPLLRMPELHVGAQAQPYAVDEQARRRQQFTAPAGLAPLPVRARFRLALPGVETSGLHAVQQLRFDGQGQLHALFVGRQELHAGVNVWDLASSRTVLARETAAQGEYDVAQWLGTDWAVSDVDGAKVRAATGQRLLAPLEGGAAPNGAALAADAEVGRLYRLNQTVVEVVAADGRRLPDVQGRGVIAGIAAKNGRLVVRYRSVDTELFAGSPLVSVLFRRAPERPGGDEEPSEVIEELMLSADGRYLQTVSNVSAYEAPDIDTAQRLGDGKSLGTNTALAPLPARANRIVTLDGRAHHLMVWDFDRNEPIARLPRQRSRDATGYPTPLRAAISDDGKRVASGSPDGLVRVWDVDAHVLLGEVRVGAEVTALAFNASGRQMAVARQGGEVWVLALP